MGQVLKKFMPKESKEEKELRNELNGTIDVLVTQKFRDFGEAKKWEKPKFLHAVYEVIDKLSEREGAMQYRLPTVEEIETAFNQAHPPTRTAALTKDELKKIISELITPARFHIGKGAQDILLFMFGVPIAATLLKRALPGPTAFISDDVLLPAVTSGTVYFLAKTDRL